MPVRWDSDKKVTLFVTIMNTHQVAVDAQRVVDAWPGDGDEKPTARAIKEILGKIKKNVATKSGGTSATTTPVKVTNARPKATPQPKATPRSAKKRKRFDDSSDSDSPAPSSTRKELKELGGGSPTPKKRANKNVATTCVLPNGSEDQSVTANGSVNERVGYPTPADTASPAETTAFRSTPRRAASAKIANYIKEEQITTDENDDEENEAANDEVTSEADSDVSAWENNLVEEV
ncbi:uncharacterized protein J3D65DRAFT_479557 [Phyllosticta citribraziliensis]|uniref:Uncharacterized protein n=1 Tax=Phyllosticta citribraziliensis TaxID=989973 RepID=A0ABR1LGC3_9PEZI